MSGMERTTARAGLERLLLALPLAAREDGVDVDELARHLDTEPQRVLRDLKEVESRNDYLPAGLGDQIQITVAPHRLNVWTTGEFQRPVRLTPREALALELALRVRVGAGSQDDAGGSSPTFRKLRTKLVEALRSPPSEEAEDPQVALGGAEAGHDSLRERIQEAADRHLQVHLTYRPPGRDARRRRVAPLLLVHAEGRWYLLGRDLDREGFRAFRLDRVVDAEVTEERFTPSAEDDQAMEAFLQDGRVQDGGREDDAEAFEAVVDYAPSIARWIREHGWENTEELPDGGLRVRHQLLDPEWLLRHVLWYGPDAHVLEPDWMRARIVEAIRPLSAASHSDTP